LQLVLTLGAVVVDCNHYREVQMRSAPRSGCPINAAVEVLGDPWATLVLRDVMFGNRRHFRELLAGSEEGIASNILSSRLKQLTAAGLLTRAEAQRGQRATYSLTEAGIQVLPVLVALGTWGLAHRDGSRRLRVRAEVLRDGGPDLVAALMDELREVHLGLPRPDPAAPRPSERLQAAYDDATRLSAAR
jgi:DNA-binding HxlR family transcriptional regulator